MPEPRAIGDVGQGEFGLGEQFLYSLRSRLDDHFVSRSVQSLVEAIFQDGARDKHVAQYVGDLDSVARVFVNEPHGLGYYWIGNRHDVARLASHDVQRWQESLLDIHSLSTHQAIQQDSRVVAHAKRIEHDARKRRAGHLAGDVVVADADDGDLLGHGNARDRTGFEQLQSTEIVARHDADRFGQLLHPTDDVLHFEFPGVVPKASWSLCPARVDVADVGLTRGLGKCVAPAVGPIQPVVTDVGKMLETTLQEVLGRHAAYGGVVVGDQRHSHPPQLLVQIDHRNVRVGRELPDVGRVDPRNDSVARPFLEPLGHAVANAALDEKDRPGAVFADVPGDSAEKLPAE